MDTVLAGKGEPVAIRNRNTPAFYCVPADLYETMMEQLDEPYRVCRRPLFLRECPDEKSKIHP